jgi:hypothetical protein
MLLLQTFYFSCSRSSHLVRQQLTPSFSFSCGSCDGSCYLWRDGRVFSSCLECSLLPHSLWATLLADGAAPSDLGRESSVLSSAIEKARCVVSTSRILRVRFQGKAVLHLCRLVESTRGGHRHRHSTLLTAYFLYVVCVAL